MRPRGEIREVLADTMQRLVAQHGPVTCRALAEASQVGYDACRETLNNMRRAGEVVVAGREKPAGTMHWHKLYEPTAQEMPVEPWGGIERLANVVQTWASPTGD